MNVVIHVQLSPVVIGMRVPGQTYVLSSRTALINNVVFEQCGRDGYYVAFLISFYEGFSTS